MKKQFVVVMLVMLVLVSALVLRNSVDTLLAHGTGPAPPTPWLTAHGTGPAPPTPWVETDHGTGPPPPTPWRQ